MKSRRLLGSLLLALTVISLPTVVIIRRAFVGPEPPENPIDGAQKLAKMLSVGKLKTEIRKSVAAKSTKFTVSNRELGSIPPEIGQLKDAKIINLSGNRLESLPKEIGRLNGLTSLSIDRNRLKALPEEIGHLRNLESLDLSRNSLASLPREIGRLEKLTELDLSHNHLSELPPELGQLARLKKLILNDNPWRDPPPSVVSQGTPKVMEYLQRKLKERVPEE